ncbi:MAG: DMT family transporter [Boseongicola sp. SB0677_bin_26]|nr:DMT family transporter [Boseongicola sp. SB0665_bin_10]MYG25714.1 DMT family transporter [Boseongicola sp. SB0677_bin_26]
MTRDQPVIGVLLMLGFCMVVPMGDAIAKLLGDHVDVAFLVAVRMAIQAMVLLPVVALAGISLAPALERLRLITVRAILHVLGMGLMFLSLRYLPLADAVAIAFVMPFIILLLGRFVLGESVGSRRMIACCVGFIGTLMVMQPSLAEVGWPALLPVAVAIDFAFFVLATRRLAKEVDAVALQAVSGVIACALLVPFLAVLAPRDIPGFALEMPDPVSMWLLAAMGLLGTCAHLMMTWSLRFAPSATVAPMQYLEIPIAALLGWLIFKDFPNGLALAGILVTMASGLYVIYREHALDRSARRLPVRGGSSEST